MEEPKHIKVFYHPSKVLALAYWRCIWPANQLALRGELMYSSITNYFIDALPYTNADAVVIQRTAGKGSVDYIRQLSELSKKADFRLIYDVDDVVFLDDVPDFHYCKSGNKEDPTETSKEIMDMCDEITVSTQYLKDYYHRTTGIEEISVLPNRIPYSWAGNFYSEEYLKRNFRKHRKKPRIIYAGSSSHIDCAMINDDKDDFSDVLKVMIATRHEFTWVFIASCPRLLLPYVETKEMEYYNWSPLGLLPKVINTLEPNMMIAPLADNPYNHGKSNIKFLEASAQGLPIACQDITPYKEAPIRFKTGEEMIEKIRATLKNEESYLEASRKGKEIVDQQWLEIDSNISKFRDVYSFPFGDPRRGG
jgi:hypothetical protein